MVAALFCFIRENKREWGYLISYLVVLKIPYESKRIRLRATKST